MPSMKIAQFQIKVIHRVANHLSQGRREITRPFCCVRSLRWNIDYHGSLLLRSQQVDNTEWEELGSWKELGSDGPQGLRH